MGCHGKGVSSLLGYSFAPKIRAIRKRAVSHGAEILIHRTFESSWPRHYDMRKDRYVSLGSRWTEEQVASSK